MESDTEIPPKRPRTEKEPNICVICGSGSSIENLNKPRDQESWRTLLKAAEIQQCDAILHHRDATDVPDIFYHLNCRKLFTHKKTLQKLEEQPGPSGSYQNKADRLQRAKRDGESSGSRVYEKLCIFCQKATKYVKGTRSKEPLIQAVDLRADKSVRQMAESKMDTAILAITSRDIVAAEAHYHRSCYRTYTRVKPKESPSGSGDDIEHAYSQEEKEAYDMLFSYMRTNLFLDPRIVPMIHLIEILVSNMNSLGVYDIKRQTKNHIRRKLEAEFGKTIEIITDDKGKLFVLPDNLSREMIVKENLRLAAELDSTSRVKDCDKLIQNSALEIRADVKKCKSEHQWPPQPDKLKNEYIPLPKSLTNFLKVLLTGNTYDSMPTSHIQRLIQSFGQDYIYAISRGTQKPAKHILLPWAVKSLTGNVELIKFVNRLGHGISYDQLEEMDTAYCLQKLTMEDEFDVPMPSNLCFVKQ